jgi:hypothetical protein
MGVAGRHIWTTGGIGLALCAYGTDSYMDKFIDKDPKFIYRRTLEDGDAACTICTVRFMIMQKEKGVDLD